MKALSFLFLFSTCLSYAQPDADLFLFNIVGGGDTVRFEYVKNITKREGYDNQPCFSPDGRHVYYSAKYKLTHDIYRYDLQTDRTVNISKSPYSSEFSPMVMEDGKHISAVFIEEDSVTQRLWKINIASAKPKLLNKKIDSVGYYWPTQYYEYYAFILGTTEHNHTLRKINTNDGTEELITDSIKGCIRKCPGSGISFVQEDKFGNNNLVVFDRKSLSLLQVFTMPENAVDYVWLNGYLIIPVKSKILVYKSQFLPGQAIPTITPLIVERDLFESPVTNARRPALSPDNTKLILVGDDEKINE